MIAIFDLDGTLALNDHRQHFLEEKPKNWKAFEEACVDDKPNVALCGLFYRLRDIKGTSVFILSGRSDDVRKQTEKWLFDKRLIPTVATASLFQPERKMQGLFMRKSGDYRDDREVKREMFEFLKKDTYCKEQIERGLVIVFDDRQKVVDMWREMGLTCCQVAPGNF